MSTPDRLNRVSSVETAKMVLSIISRSVAAATSIVTPPFGSMASGSCGKSFGSRLTILNFERPAWTSTQPAAVAFTRSSSAVTSRLIS